MKVGLIGLGNKGATTVWRAVDAVSDDELFSVAAWKYARAGGVIAETVDYRKFIEDEDVEDIAELGEAMKETVALAASKTDFVVLVVDSSREWAREAGRLAVHLLDSGFGGTIHSTLYLVDEGDRMSDGHGQFNEELGVLSDSEFYIDKGEIEYEDVGRRLGLFYGSAWYSDETRQDIEWVAQSEGFVLGHASIDVTRGRLRTRISKEETLEGTLEKATYQDPTAEVGVGSGRRTLVVFRVPHSVVTDKQRVKQAVDEVIDTDARVVFIRNEEFEDVDIVVARG